MPKGNRKYKCDCCGRYYPKSKYGYYKVNYNGEEIILCDYCHKVHETRGLNLDELLPIEKYFLESDDRKCKKCGRWFEPSRTEFKENVCEFCRGKREYGSSRINKI